MNSALGGVVPIKARLFQRSHGCTTTAGGYSRSFGVIGRRLRVFVQVDGSSTSHFNAITGVLACQGIKALQHPRGR